MSEMPEILFRGKRVDNGSWVCGSLLAFDCGKKVILPSAAKVFMQQGTTTICCNECYDVDPATVGPYTDLTDKNGVKIFVDDIVHVHDTTLQCSKPYHEFEGYVDFSFGIFQILDANGMDHFQWPDYEIEVIGNIHDNPELLEGDGEA